MLHTVKQFKLIVVIPAYNEAESIADTITSLRTKAEDLKKGGVDTCLYVVDDGSKDKTADLALEAGADRVIRHQTNVGLGAAVRSGFNAARTDGAHIAVKFDADLQHDPDDLPALIKPIIDDEADVVYGNRLERIDYRMPFIRRTGNKVFTALMRWLTRWPLKDSQPGILAVGQAYLCQFYLPGDYNYTQQILIDAYHKGMRFTHVPVAFRKRLTGNSFISLQYPLKVLPQIIEVIIGVKPLRLFGPIGLLFLLAGVLMGFWDFIDFLRGLSEKPVQQCQFCPRLLPVRPPNPVLRSAGRPDCQNQPALTSLGGRQPALVFHQAILESPGVSSCAA